MTLEGYSLDVTDDSSTPKKDSSVIRLQGMGKMYLLHDEDKDNVKR